MSAIVVTGMGAISAAGIGVDALWDAAREGRSTVSEVALDGSRRNRITFAARLLDFLPERYIEQPLLRFCDRFTQFAVIAADQALAQAGFSREKPLGDRTAVIVGTVGGGFIAVDQMEAQDDLDPLTVPRTMGSAAPSLIGMRYGCHGPTFAMSSACSSAAQAIGLGVQLIRAGVVDRAIVGGTEATLSSTAIYAWEMLRVLTPDFCRPFSRGRNGMVLGEGAGIFVLETAAAAEKRGVTPLAEVAGYGTTSGGKDIVRSDPDGPAAAMQTALFDANLSPGAIDYVNAHGTGTYASDIDEAQALRQVFGSHLTVIAISSTKPIHDDAIGSSRALEFAITVKALNDSVVPPTINWLERDPKCGFDPVPNRARQMPIRAAMTNSFSFGGINASLIVTPAG